MPAVFLCHSSLDKDFVRGLAETLREAGIQVWVDEAEINIGDSLIGRISEAIEQVDFILAVLSPNSVASNWVQKELSMAMTREIEGKRVTVLPALLEECELPGYLKDKLYADFTNPWKYDSSLKRILEAVGAVFEETTIIPKPLHTHGAESSGDIKEWVKESRERWEKLKTEKLPEEEPSRFRYGIWIASYIIQADLEKPTLGEFKDILLSVKDKRSGWPLWLIPSNNYIYPYEGLIECWLAEPGLDLPKFSDFWRASPLGRMFLIRGLDDDCNPDRVTPGTEFDVTLPIWRVGECLLHAERLTNALFGEHASIQFFFAWEGVSERRLSAWASHTRGAPVVLPTAHQESIASIVEVVSSDISKVLPEIVISITRPLYELFDFYEPESVMINEELNEMIGEKRY